MRQVYKGVAASKKLFSKAASDQVILLKEVEEFVQPFIDEIEEEKECYQVIK